MSIRFNHHVRTESGATGTFSTLEDCVQFCRDWEHSFAAIKAPGLRAEYHDGANPTDEERAVLVVWRGKFQPVEYGVYVDDEGYCSLDQLIDTTD